MGSYSKGIQNVAQWSGATAIGTGMIVLGNISTSAIPSTDVPTKVQVSGNCIIGAGNNSGTRTFNVGLCDANGQNKVVVKSGTAALYSSEGATTGGTDISPFTVNISNGSALKGRTLQFYVESTGGTYLKWRGNMTVTITTAKLEYTITLSSQTGGSCTANYSKAAPGTTVTLTPTANTGYAYDGFTLNGTAKTGTTFSMPSANATVVAKFKKVSYAITLASSPSGAGTVTSNKSTANYGDSVTVSQTAATGYYFNGWTSSPSVTISSGTFTMPAAAIRVTANYLKRSTGSLNKSSMAGGSTVTLTISPDKTTYSHKYKLSFGTGMETSNTTVAAGTTSVSISVPLNWSASIPSATSKTGGTLTLETYNGSTKIGTYTITGLTYTVPSSVVPTLTDITASIARTINGTTYANVGSYYVQNHCGVRVQTTASGAQSSTISSVVMSISGYSGTAYKKTQSAAALDFTTGLLTIAGSTTITVTATDSRGRTATKTKTITVTAYQNPGGTLSVWRVDLGGDADEFGEYGQYSLTTSYSAIGSNSITTTLACNSQSVTNPNSSGDILPGTRLTLNTLNEYEVTLTVTDAFETTTIRARIRSAKFVIYVNADGTKMGIMKAANKTIPSGKDSTFEISANCQIYIGDSKLEDYLLTAVRNTVGTVVTGTNEASLSVPSGTTTIISSMTLAAGTWVIVAGFQFENSINGTICNGVISYGANNVFIAGTLVRFSTGKGGYNASIIVSPSASAVYKLNAYQETGSTNTATSVILRAVRIA